MTIRVINGTVADPKSGLFEKRDLYIENDKIVGIYLPGEKQPVADQTIDAAACIVAPGLIDVHVHFRDPGQTYKEDIHTGAAAAAAGGFTTVICMANTVPVIDTKDAVSYVIQEGSTTGIHVLTCAAITKGFKGEEVTDMSQLKESGAVGFTDDGIPLMNAEVLRVAMDKAYELNVPLSLHEEDKTKITNNGINEGIISEQLHIKGSPREAEIELIRRDLELALLTKASVNIQHISTAEGVALVREAKKKGNNIHAEGTPHHFSLTEDAILQHKALAKVNPPLRTQADRRAVIDAIADKTIDIIATDHAPHSAEEKQRELLAAPSGMIGLETSLALAMTHLYHEEHIPILAILDRMTMGPAHLYHLDAGYIAAGGPADLVIFSPEEEWTVKSFVSKSKNSPFIGEQLKGRVRFTVCDGIVVYQTEDK